MQNFTFHNPTKIVFGKGQIAAIAQEIPADARVLVTYGAGSIKRNGVYGAVMAALPGRAVGAFGGIEPNPKYETLMRAVEKIRAEGWDYLLAVGGGSVLDGTKFIAAAVPFTGGDPWDIVAKGAEVKSAVPIGAVLTLPATGSESNAFAVISRESCGDKLAFSTPLVFPKFAVLDPEATFSLPPRQVANGVVDAFAHTLEQYLTFPAAAPLQDRFAEGILLTLIEVGPGTLADPTDYEARAAFMWTATLALNGLIGCGVPQDWVTHMIGHEITAMHGLDHAQTLAVVFPAVMDARRGPKRDKLLQYGERVWGIRSGSEDERIDAAIARTREFFSSLGVKTRFSEYGIGADVREKVAERFEKRGWRKLGERGDVGPKEASEILAYSL
ncbi:MAG TPA: iron-containing alcohol dehydrogenase [Bryobacteraceae bacterium]|nr:iron-containing alcohol dehydrogenase [Bryobacteraceae bacterium]